MTTGARRRAGRRAPRRVCVSAVGPNATSVKARTEQDSYVVHEDRMYLRKAQESVAGARVEYEAKRFNNCANRAYYACFQAAIHALARDGIMPTGRGAAWGHDFVQSQFVGQLVNRRHIYSPDHRTTLAQNYRLRVVADYDEEAVAEVRALRSLARAEALVKAVAAREPGA